MLAEPKWPSLTYIKEHMSGSWAEQVGMIIGLGGPRDRIRDRCPHEGQTGDHLRESQILEISPERWIRAGMDRPTNGSQLGGLRDLQGYGGEALEDLPIPADEPMRTHYVVTMTWKASSKEEEAP